MSLSDNLKVCTGSAEKVDDKYVIEIGNAVPAADRKTTCQTKKMVQVDVCDHPGSIFVTTEETHRRQCSHCLTAFADEAHRFETYVYQGGATCTSNGTEIALCADGCGISHEREAANTAPGHAYGAPVWTWSDDHSVATAIFACEKGDDTKTVKDTSPVQTEVSAATATADQVVKYTAAVTFNGKVYKTETENITVPGTSAGEPDTPSDPSDPDHSSGGNVCKWDNVDHGTSFRGRLVKFFHSILYFFAHLFGLK